MVVVLIYVVSMITIYHALSDSDSMGSYWVQPARVPTCTISS